MITNFFGLLLAEMVPSCDSIIFLQLAKPNPVPRGFVEYSGSNSLSKLDISGPESEIVTIKSFSLSK